ncbi:hypothetical protein GCM10010922_15750 [Microbacterium sorbitolivorans]|uniref:DUF58 domain-containing protein n=1 Tax=Microbacterium sorbitolivorans TaxID=1867410 RepID=A0A367Y4I2_9MICO|nr:DUF58 domain-containing protein [Microbacterium sorbitolivorans]RCK59921.1 DUF58 domain-containing protein [Microbacterium sorbitolivorans]GGF41147.1 hypothetical protein GCM10010922_15750 [Microbacterium sorbitolivorans]
MTSLLPAVASRLFVHTRLASAHPLDGAYASLVRGRSMDFEDLRDYQFGDDVRDVDWKATARHGELLVKRSRARRMHSVVFAVDTGLDMASLSPDERPKSELAILAVGAIGLLSHRHGDDLSMILADEGGSRRLPARRSEGALELALREIRDRTADTRAASDRAALLAAIVSTVKRRSIVVVVAGEAPLDEREEKLLRRLQAQHDVVWVSVRDADPVVPRGAVDARTRWVVPAHLRGNKNVLAEIAEQRRRDDAARDGLLDSLEVSHVELAHADTAVPQVLRMLARRPRVRGS